MNSVYLSCKQAARSLNVSQSTIKRLCDDGVLVSIRTPGGHRRISLKSVQNWQHAAGHRVTDTAGSKREVTAPVDYQACCRCLLEAHQTSDLLDALRRLHRKITMAEICDSVLGPALVMLGYLYSSGQASHQQVIAASQRMRGLICRLSAELIADQSSGYRAVGATAPGDPADLASLFVEATLRELGWAAESLGTGLSGLDLAEAAEHSQADLVWVCYTHAQELDVSVEHNRMLVSQLPKKSRLVLGGGALNSQLRKQLAFHFFGDSMVHLSQFVSGQLTFTAAA